MNYSIILAGGIGSRFWPLSTNTKPKQFLKFVSNKPLLVESIERASSLTNKKNIYIATNKIYKKQTEKYIKKFGIPYENFLFEKESKNNFAPISVLSNLIFSKDKDAVIAVFPSDHFIKDKNIFLKTLKKALIFAKKGNIITLGSVPKRPETGYGYIKINSKFKVKNSKLYKVERFIEKPDLKKAKGFLKDRRYYWNAGIFIFKAQTLLEEIKRIYPKVYEALSKITNKKDVDKFWPEFPSVSIDYAVMEKTDKLKLVPLNCGWSDLGSWQAIEEIKKKDKNANTFICKNIDLGSKNTLVWSECRLVATLGLRDLIIVDTKDALLVCSKDKAQEVKKIVEILKRRNIKQIE